MSNKDGGGPAFPLTADVIRNVSAMLAASDLPAERRDYLLEKFGERATGMTMRDYFAAKAMQAEMITTWSDATPEAAEDFVDAAARAGRTPEDHLAFNAYAVADAMLKARDA